MRRLRAGGQAMQHFPALVLALGLDAMSQHHLRSRLMHARIELETAAVVRLIDRPSGKNLGGLGDIALRIAAVHAEGMEFEQLASVVLVESIVLFLFRIRLLPGA